MHVSDSWMILTGRTCDRSVLQRKDMFDDAKKKLQPCETGNEMDMEGKTGISPMTRQAAKTNFFDDAERPKKRDDDQRKISKPTRMHMMVIVVG
jgi:hypothetical protein